MKIEDEIKQSTFKSPEQKLAINIFYTANWLNYYHAHFFKKVGITVQQYNVLRILRGQYPKICNLKVIKDRMLDRMSDASRIVDKLVLKGLVERKTCPEDRRNVNILISPKGLNLLKELYHIDELGKQVFESLTSDEVNELNRLLDKLRDSKPLPSVK